MALAMRGPQKRAALRLASYFRKLINTHEEVGDIAKIGPCSFTIDL
jgi:hypothetical protein